MEHCVLLVKRWADWQPKWTSILWETEKYILLQTVCFVPGERKPLHFILTPPTQYKHAVNMEFFSGLLRVHIKVHIKGFDFTLHQKFVCIFIWQEISNQRKWSAAPSASGSCLFIADRYQRISLRVIRDLSDISRGGGGRWEVGIINLGSEMSWSISAMGVKFVNPPLELGLKYHDPPPLA